MTYDEFRLLIEADVQNPDRWSIRVENCPQAIFNIPYGFLTPTVPAAEIARLRNNTAPPDVVRLRQLGTEVFNSIMPQAAFMGFQLCLQNARASQKGLRLVVEIRGNARTAHGVSLIDVPLEAVFHQQLDFIATDIHTPVSRGVVTRSDRDPAPVTLPLRILLVISEPSDLPPVNAAAERQAILDALEPLIASRAVVVDFCTPPTLTELNARLQEGFHIVHFIGHGDYEVVGLDPNPQPHLYFEDGTANRFRKAAEAGQIFSVLRNGNVPLIVLTACSTAASAPNGTNYPVVAFEGLAQNLVERQAGPLAAVAMQFDLETEAAEVFSRAFYLKLLSPEWTLDAAVSHARTELVGRFNTGHRSWVNPTLYWRCREGRIFDIVNMDGSELSADERAELLQLDAVLDVHLNMLEELAKQPVAARVVTADLETQWKKKIEDLITQRGLLLGDSVRLRGGKIDENGLTECSLTVRLRLPVMLGDATLAVRADSPDFALTTCEAGADAPPNSIFLQMSDPLISEILVRNASANMVWNPGEYELAKIKFKFPNPAVKPIFQIQIARATIVKNGAAQNFRIQNAVVFGNP